MKKSTEGLASRRLYRLTCVVEGVGKRLLVGGILFCQGTGTWHEAPVRGTLTWSDPHSPTSQIAGIITSRESIIRYFCLFVWKFRDNLIYLPTIRDIDI